MEDLTPGNSTNSSFISVTEDMQDVQVLAKSYMMYRVGEYSYIWCTYRSIFAWKIKRERDYSYFRQKLMMVAIWRLQCVVGQLDQEAGYFFL